MAAGKSVLLALKIYHWIKTGKDGDVTCIAGFEENRYITLKVQNVRPLEKSKG